MLAALACSGCGNDSAGTPSGDTQDECRGRAVTVQVGSSETSSGGYVFEILELDPDPPILSQSEPGNTWKLGLTDAAGTAVSDASIVVRSRMPDHNHDVPEAFGVQQAPGVYAIESLLLPMPAYYELTVEARVGDATEAVRFKLCITPRTG